LQRPNAADNEPQTRLPHKCPSETLGRPIGVIWLCASRHYLGVHKFGTQAQQSGRYMVETKATLGIWEEEWGMEKEMKVSLRPHSRE
jgi:hypothetical protein